MKKMVERDGEQVMNLLRERPLETFDDELSEEEEDNEEIEHEEDDVQEADEDLDFDPQMFVCTEYADEPKPDETSSKKERRSIIRGQNNFQWFANVPQTRVKNSLKFHSPSAKLDAKDVKTPLESWSLLFSTEIIQMIVQRTNEEIGRKFDKKSTQPYYGETEYNEVKALFGLLYFSGLNKHNHTSTEELWTPRFGPNLYRAVMTKHRFHFLLTSLRFDEKSTRTERRNVHGLAPIKEIWDLFVSNCTKYYSPSNNCTIDEQLLNFRGRFGAKVYIPSKSDKCGIKIVSMNDAETSYMLNAEPYVGRFMTNGIELANYYVRKLSEPIYNSDRNVTCDNWFMSVNIAEKMKTEHSVTMVGTLRKNKLEVPSSFTRTASSGTIRYAYTERCTLISYCPKKNKVVLLLSSRDEDATMDQEGKKPRIDKFYNHTKGGTETFEQLCKTFSTARITPRWTERFFFGMLDQAGVNSMILYNLRSNNQGLNRRCFLRDLAFSLVQPLLLSRLRITSLPNNLKMLIREILEIKEEDPGQKNAKLTKRKRCSVCPWKGDRKTMYCCAQCGKPVCEEHRTHFCKDCAP